MLGTVTEIYFLILMILTGFLVIELAEDFENTFTETCTGVIRGIERESLRDEYGKRTYTLDVEYIFMGQTTRSTLNHRSSRTYKTGMNIMIRVNPNKPEQICVYKQGESEKRKIKGVIIIVLSGFYLLKFILSLFG